jgi:hypothetical protein
MRVLDPLTRTTPVARALLGGLLLLVAAYVVVFLISGGARNTLPGALVDALINVGALVVWGAIAWWANSRVVLDRAAWQQALVHPLGGFGFAVAWYFSVTVLLGWRAGEFSGSFSVRPFSSVAFIWQVFQGLTVYALIVSLAVIQRLLDRQPSAAQQSTERLLVRGDDQLLSVPVDEILCIERAGDYAQLITLSGRHLTRRSLAELERQLPPERFLRVHRSQLINLNALEAAESIGGGRLRARLRGGIQVDTSRAGAKVLRERAG